MSTKLQEVTDKYQSISKSQPKLLIGHQPRTFLKLSHKRNDPQKNPTQESQIATQNQQYPTSIKALIKKLTCFIQKVQDTIKKILYQKDVKSYIAYAHTSQSEIIDNFNRALDKFKGILYKLKEEMHCNQKESFATMKHSQGYKSTQSFLSNITQGKKLNNFKGQERIRFNCDVLSFLLQYFQQHMIPQTHWSLKQKLKKKMEKVDVFSKYFGSWRNSNGQNDLKEESVNIQKQKQKEKKQKYKQPKQLQITQTVSHMMQQINRQQLQMAQKSFNNPNNTQIILKPVEQTLNAILKIQDLKPIQQMSSTQKIAYLLDLQSKIFVSGEFIESAAYFEDDITTLPRQHYSKVWQFINENHSGNEKTIIQEYKVMKMLMVITNASVIRELQTDSVENSWFKKLVFGLSFPRYFIDFSRAQLQNQKFLRKPNVQTTKSIWNLPQNGFIKELKKPLIFDFIGSNFRFWIQRTPSRNLKSFKNRKHNPTQNIFLQKQNAFKVRLLNHKQLQVNTQTTSNPIPSTQTYQTIIIHYHGGGFIALSSCTSQSYTRKWANSLKVPVFSVDYGKPPQYRFPIPVMDCLDAYVFITRHIEKYFPQIKPKRIFVTGDSAGGNLACSLTALALKLQLPLPQGLLLVYPAVDTRTKFTPSRINSFNDVILYPTLLLLCMQEYLGKQQNQYNQLASPILLTEDFVSDTGDKRWPLKWPKTILMVGRKDPLYDDTLRLCQKLASSNIEFHCEIYKHLSHAFLSIDKMLPECANTIQDSIKFFEILFKGQKIGTKNLL